MPRRARLLVENACYHVVCRGNQKNDIFIDQEAYEYYEEKLIKYKKKFPTYLYAIRMVLYE